MTKYSFPLALGLVLVAEVMAIGFESRHMLRSFDEPDAVVLRGKVRCIEASGSEAAAGEECGTGSRFVLTTHKGRSYRFQKSDLGSAMFVDPRVRRRELQVAAVVHPGDELEVIKVHSVSNGRLYDIYYFCEVCNVTAYAPGPCSCCRQELEFREVPVDRP